MKTTRSKRIATRRSVRENSDHQVGRWDVLDLVDDLIEYQDFILEVRGQLNVLIDQAQDNGQMASELTLRRLKEKLPLALP